MHIKYYSKIAGLKHRCTEQDAGTYEGYTQAEDNPYDPNAIAIYTDEGKHVGYIPKEETGVFRYVFNGDTNQRCRIAIRTYGRERTFFDGEIEIKPTEKDKPTDLAGKQYVFISEKGTCASFFLRSELAAHGADVQEGYRNYKPGITDVVVIPSSEGRFVTADKARANGTRVATEMELLADYGDISYLPLHIEYDGSSSAEDSAAGAGANAAVDENAKFKETAQGCGCLLFAIIAILIVLFA